MYNLTQTDKKKLKNLTRELDKFKRKLEKCEYIHSKEKYSHRITY